MASSRTDYIDISNIFVDSRYQRPVNETWVRKIAKNFDDDKANMLVLSERENGTMWVIDGNHTIQAARIVHGEHALLPARIFKGLSLEDEADMFYSLNSNKKALSYGDKLKGLYAAGDTDAIEYVKTLNDSGIRWTFNNQGDAFHAHQIGFRWFQRVGRHNTLRAFVVMQNANDVAQYNGKFFAGIAYLLDQCEIDDLRLAKCILSTRKEDIERVASVYKEGSPIANGNAYTGIARAYALAFASFYNKKLTAKNRIDLTRL